MSSLRIGLVCNEYPPGPHGGIGSATQLLARALVAAGHRVRVIGMYPARYPAPDHEDDQGVEVYRLRRSGSRFDWPGARYRLYRAIAAWAARGEIDLIEVPDWEGWAAGWPRLPVPVVARLNGTTAYFAAELERPANRTASSLERASLLRADFWCSVSAYTAERTQKLFHLRRGPHAILHNFVESRPAPSFENRIDGRVLYTGTLTPKKGIISLIRAWPKVCAACPQAELHVYGKDGRTDAGESMRSYLERQLNGRIGRSVHFHGHSGRAMVLEGLECAHAAVFPSYAEAFALAPLEAMACGCPTIYSRRGSGAELIGDGRHGLLVDPDQPDEIAAAIVAVLRDGKLAGRLGEAGKQRVAERFSIGSALPDNVAFYRSCIDEFHDSGKPQCSCR